MRLAIVTGNPHKAREIGAFLSGTVEAEHVLLDCPEFRDDQVGPIAREKARFAWATLGRPLIVDDTGFFVAALNGFPGPYAAYVLSTIGNTGLLRLLEGSTDRSGYFVTAVAYADEEGIRVFEGRLDGEVTAAPRGTGGFGHDPVFAVAGRTLAEIPLEEKNRFSHRARALSAFRDWFREDRIGDNR